MPHERHAPPPHLSVPDEDEIAALLRSLRPRPGARFYRRMAAAPWRLRGGGSTDLHSRLMPSPVLLLAVFVLLAATLFVTPMRIFAQEVLGFFTRADSDTMIVRVPVERGWQLPPPPASTPLTVTAAEKLAGFQVQVPAGMPHGYRFEGAYYLEDSGGVQLAYVAEHEALVTITQWPANRAPASAATPDPDVGASASIFIVRIGSVMGEYVRGGWTLAEDQVAADTEGGMVSLQVMWDPEAAMQALRWQDGYVLYEIAVTGGVPGSDAYLDRDDVVMLARALQ